MNPRRPAEQLRELEVPGEREAEQRAWALAKRAFSEREPTPRRPTARRLVLAAAAALVLALALLSPAGAAIRNWVSDVIGKEHARPALTSLPAPGKLLVDSERGTWVVQADGSQRLLGDYREATWSPHGVYVAATRGPHLTALEADGDPHWTVTGSQPATMPNWQAPDGFRIAYLSGSSLRVVAGDGTADREIARRIAPVAPVWRPGARHVLAYVGEDGAVRFVNTDSGRRLFSQRFPDIGALAWSHDGSSLAVATDSQIAVARPLFTRGREPDVRMSRPQPNSAVEQLSYSPSGDRLAFIRRSTESSAASSELVLASLSTNGINQRILFSGPGQLTDPTWSPNGRWLLVGWRDADQWLFIDTRNPSKVVAIANIARQFDPGGEGTGAFPRISGWCCAP
jgi:dipeptidyl aminopeptidase/acylaminoacyl peptidase